MVENNLLAHELQLGEQLNQCVQSKRRADFSLMLAMLTEDVREHSQFFLPKTQPTETQITDSLLRKTLHLTEPAALALDNIDEIEQFSQAEFIVEQRLADLHLQNALSPLPLSFRDDVNFIKKDVLSDTSLHCQQRFRNKKSADTNELSNAMASFNAKAWLDNIQTTVHRGSYAVA